MSFSRLLSELPSVGSSDDPDVQIRAVLSPLVARMVSAGSFASVSPDPATCPNCSCLVSSLKTPYCSAFCRDQAAFIRQFRGSVCDGSIFEPERQMGMGQALWSLVGGGFPRRQALVPARVVAKVLERDGGVCQVCGAPATEIDHTGSG